MHGSVVRAVAIVAAVAAVLAGGLVAIVHATSRRDVVVVGDSLSAWGGAQLSAAADDAGYHLSIDAIPGMTLADRLDVVARSANRRPARMIVELGTNDVLDDTNTDDYGASITSAVGAVQWVPCVLFVDVGLVEGPQYRAAAFNSALVSAVSGHPNVHVYDWAADYTSHPEWSADGVHLRSDTWRNYAELVIAALRSSCGGA